MALRAGLLVGGYVFQFRAVSQLRDEFCWSARCTSSSVSGSSSVYWILRAAHPIVDRNILDRLHIK